MFINQRISPEYRIEYMKSPEYTLRKALYSYSCEYDDIFYFCPSLLSFAEVCEKINELHAKFANKYEKEKWDNDWKDFNRNISMYHITDKYTMIETAMNNTAVFKFLTVKLAKEIICSRYYGFEDESYGLPRSINYIRGEFNEKRELIDHLYKIKVFANPEHTNFTGISLIDGHSVDMRAYLDYDFECFNKDDEKETYYELKNLNSDDVRNLKNILMKHGLFVTYSLMHESEDIYEPAYNSPIIAPRYRCAYCGKLLNKNEVTVDHIFPVAKMVSNEKVRNKAAKYGITETNDLNNLAASCAKCNEKKSDKMGLWIYRGLFGRKESNWRILFGIMAVVLIIIAVVLIKSFIWPTISPILTGEYGPLYIFFGTISLFAVIAWNNKDKLEFL